MLVRDVGWSSCTLHYFFAPAASSLRITPWLSSLCSPNDFASERAVRPSGVLTSMSAPLSTKSGFEREVVASSGCRDHQGRDAKEPGVLLPARCIHVGTRGHQRLGNLCPHGPVQADCVQEGGQIGVDQSEVRVGPVFEQSSSTSRRPEPALDHAMTRTGISTLFFTLASAPWASRAVTAFSKVIALRPLSPGARFPSRRSPRRSSHPGCRPAASVSCRR